MAFQTLCLLFHLPGLLRLSPSDLNARDLDWDLLLVTAALTSWLRGTKPPFEKRGVVFQLAAGWGGEGRFALVMEKPAILLLSLFR